MRLDVVLSLILLLVSLITLFLYEKYNVEEADVNSYRSSYSNEIRDYLKEHPELKWNDTPEKQKFNIAYAKLTWAWVEEELKKRRGK